ncbi:MAG: hypothetical protein QHH43_06150 [Candidatus Saccharicenans sp.]|jgi:hypothetical protein|nr:hypothetical protein [Candidatus Saccharicenans sp.]MDH7575322.1 hypothetical protein [Candidatus Saccharicenans sp.]
MEKEWLEKFYSECGREVSLAYNVLNHTNTWGLTLVTALLSTTFLSAVKLGNFSIRFIYPTTYHWYIVIITWIIMLRFFVRSALALTNMYRWNELIYATAKLLSIPQESLYRDLLERNLKKKIDAYYFKWKSPRPKLYVAWQNLKLMYLWLFIIILSLFLWGVLTLKKDNFFFLGIVIFFTATLLEVLWYSKWYGMQHEKLNLEAEPDIETLWNKNYKGTAFYNDQSILFGICLNGPFKHAYDLITNPAVRWIHLSYSIDNIEPSLTKDFLNGLDIKGKQIYLACWNENFKGEINPIRTGRIDYFSFSPNILRVNIILSDISDTQHHETVIKIINPNYLCKYLDS